VVGKGVWVMQRKQEIRGGEHLRALVHSIEKHREEKKKTYHVGTSVFTKGKGKGGKRRCREQWKEQVTEEDQDDRKGKKG